MSYVGQVAGAGQLHLRDCEQGKWQELAVSGAWQVNLSSTLHVKMLLSEAALLLTPPVFKHTCQAAQLLSLGPRKTPNGDCFWPRRLCVRHPRWLLQCVAGHCYYTNFQSSFFLSHALLLLLLTHFRESPMCENLFPQYFGISRRYMRKRRKKFR